MHPRAGKVAVHIAELCESDGVVILGRLIGLVEVIHLNELREPDIVRMNDTVLGNALSFGSALAALEPCTERSVRQRQRTRGGYTHLSDLHRHYLVLFLGHLQDLSLQVSYLLQKVLIGNDGVSEPDIFSYRKDDNEHYQDIDSHDHYDSKDRKDPAQSTEIGRVGLEYIYVVFNVEYLVQSVPQARKDLCKAFQHLGYEDKKPFKETIHNLLRSVDLS